MTKKKLDYNQVIEWHLQNGQRCKNCNKGTAFAIEVIDLNHYQQVGFYCQVCQWMQFTLYNTIPFTLACERLNIDVSTLRAITNASDNKEY